MDRIWNHSPINLEIIRGDLNEIKNSIVIDKLHSNSVHRFKTIEYPMLQSWRYSVVPYSFDNFSNNRNIFNKKIKLN